MLYYRDFEGYESQSRCKRSDRRSGLSAEGQLVVEWLQSAPQPLDGMPRWNEEGAPRFTGHPDELIWFLEDVRDLCMQAGCFKDCEWAQWSIYYLGIEEFKRWRHLLHAETDWADFLKDATRLFSLFRCPIVCYSKHDLYDLVDKQKKLSWIEKDDLFLEGFDQEFQGKILRRLKWNDRRQYVDDPWPTYQVAREAERLLEEGYHFELREACLARDQWSAREAQYEAEMRELRAAMTEEQCQEPERCSESARPGSKASQSSSSTSLKIQSLTCNLLDSSKPSKAPGEGLRSQVVEVDSIESSFECIEVTSCIAKGSLTAGLWGECLRGRIEEQSKGKVLGAKASVKLEVTEAWGDSPVSQPEYFHSSLPPHTDIQPQIPPIELRDTEDEQRVNEQPIEAEAHALEVQKPTLEPRGDLCEVPERAGSIEVEEIELEVEAEGQSKVVAQRKPPEAKIRRKSLKSVPQRIREISPELWTTHSSSRLSGWTVLLIYLQQGWTRSLGVETCATSPSTLSQPAKRSGTTALHVNDAHSLAPHTCSAAAVEIYTGLSQKSKSYLFKGYEVKAPHSAGWSTILESTAISSTRKSIKEAALRVRTPQILYKKMQKPPRVEGEAQRLRGGPHSCFEPPSSPLSHASIWTLNPFKKALRLNLDPRPLRKGFAPQSGPLTPSKRLRALIWTLNPFKKALHLDLDPQPLRKDFVPRSGPSTPSKRLCASIWTLDPFVKALCLNPNPRLELEKLWDSVLPLYLRPWVWEVTEDSRDLKTPLDVGSGSSLLRE
ncbi:hypothetical protein EDD16DRAFT_1716061 [Pisolithus croceorrhizus]|nr:hypothetical protein EV401DRAFT_2082474 [Pisolithus croceorrhizus]KAI6102390.1 hypothetical protein EDD16DRAFT_1716061 [Pisolithus croceorrhizus]KAI6162812.1 hypothetical protein EDD17DRAFT_1756829 [Pisolithus thermaeus]